MTVLKSILIALSIVLLSCGAVAFTNSQTTQEDLSGVYNPITQEQIYISVIPKQTKDCENKSIFVCEQVTS
jgi:hypothetical protein